MIHVYYRISDNNRRGKAPSYFTNDNCLNNFLRHFSPESIQIIADNVRQETLDWLAGYGHEVINTKLGNSGSFKFALDQAITRNDDDIVYFVENDYIHLPNAKQIMNDGFRLGVDYVTLYDHPDKYNPHYNVNYNQTVYCAEGDSAKRPSSVLYSAISYWKTTPSTCMTFAARVRALKEDYDLLVKHFYDAQGNFHKIPNDMGMFEDLRNKGRTLISPIPGAATHGDLLSPHIEWRQFV